MGAFFYLGAGGSLASRVLSIGSLPVDLVLRELFLDDTLVFLYLFSSFFERKYSFLLLLYNLTFFFFEPVFSRSVCLASFCLIGFDICLRDVSGDFKGIVSFDLGDFSRRESLGLGLFEYCSLSSEELWIFGLEEDCFLLLLFLLLLLLFLSF